MLIINLYFKTTMKLKKLLLMTGFSSSLAVAGSIAIVACTTFTNDGSTLLPQASVSGEV
jgi:hypothetical protein